MVRRLIRELMIAARTFTNEDTLDMVHWQADVLARGLFGLSPFSKVVCLMNKVRKSKKKPSTHRSKDFQSDLDYIVLNYYDFKHFTIPQFRRHLKGIAKPFIDDLLDNILEPDMYPIDVRFGNSFTGADVIHALVALHRCSCVRIVGQGKEYLYG